MTTMLTIKTLKDFKTMKKILFIFLCLFFCQDALFAQTPAQVVWRNGGKNGDIVTLKDAQQGVEIKADAKKNRSIYAETQNTGCVAIECSFAKNDIEAIAEDKKINFEVKWYYYMSTRKSLMGSSSITLDESQDTDGIVKFVCVRSGICSGWWEVIIKNKNTGEIIKYANQDSYQICFN